MDKIFNGAEFVRACGTSKQLPASTVPEIVFSGRSNVGKSTLINALCGRRTLARTSSSPGKTATINFYSAGDAYLVDLPGYGYAKRSQSELLRWSELMEGYFAQGRNIPLAVQLCDMRHAPTKNDHDMINFLEDRAIPYIIVLTKADKLKKTERLAREAKLPEEYASARSCLATVAFSSVTSEGREEVFDRITVALQA